MTKRERLELLRCRAELRLASSPTPVELPVDASALLHELHVQQVELEFQNDELLETQIELQESRDRYQALFDAAPVGYLVLDPEGRVLDANRTASRLLGVGRGALVDRRLQLFASDDQAVRELNEHLTRTFLAAEPKELEFSLRHGEGKTIHVRLDSQAVGGALHEPARCRTSLLDITERRRAEEALAKRSQRLLDSMEASRALERQLEEARRLEALGRLAGGVAHDFNNMLMVINGSAQVALSMLSPDAPIREDLERILTAGEQSAKLTGQLLAVGRHQRLIAECVDLASLVQETASLVRTSLGPKVHMRLTPSDEVFLAKVDPVGLQQALVNLALNARDAMPEGGDLGLSMDRVELDEAGAALQAEAQPGRYVVLAVSDDGVGLEPETRKRIFEPFFTTKATGTGLGLASVHGYVSQSGGFIAVDSSPGQGTTFRVHLPALDEPPEQPARVSPAKLTSHPEQASVLLVDDEAGLRLVVAKVLNRAGFDVVSAASGEEALELCRGRPEPFEVAVLDIQMPGMNGAQLAERLQRLAPACKFVFMSGFAQEDLMRRIEQEFGGVLLHKPFPPESLVEEVRRALAC